MATGGQKTTKKSGDSTSTAKKSSTTGRAVNNKNTKSGSRSGVKSGAKSGSKSAAKTQSGARSGSVKSKADTSKNQLFEEILVLVIFATALILILSNFNLAGDVGNKIKWFMFGLMGVVEYVFPVLVVATLIFLMSNKDMISVARVKTVAVYILSIILAAMWQRLCGEPVIADTSIGGFFTYSADNKKGGGLLGGILCKMLSPLGLLGTMVILIILAIICVIVITEKSFIKGVMNVGKGGSRMVHAAKQDYDMYKEHSKERYGQETSDDDEEESEEEYLKRRRDLKEAKYQEKLARKEELAKKKAQEREAKPRMDRKVRGVTTDTELPREVVVQEGSNFDIHEIGNDLERYDQYTDDIYEPLDMKACIDAAHEGQDVNYQVLRPANEIELEGYDSEREEISYNHNQTKSDIPMQSDYDLSDDMKSQADMKLSYDMSDEGYKVSDNKPQEDVHTGFETETDISYKKEGAKEKTKYVFPPISLLNKSGGKKAGNQARENQDTAIRLQQTLQNFGVKVTVTDISCGPSVTRYELQPEQGVKVSKIVSLADDIKLNLAAADIRIEAPIPGKAAIGIEVPNKEAGSVSLRELLETESFKENSSNIAFAAGKDIAGKVIVADIGKMPHLLIAGATGSGKSVCINTIIMSIIYKAHPEDVKLIMIDPKVVELSVYNGIPHLLTPVVTDPKKASGALGWAVAEMDARYKKFAAMGVRDLKGYNAKIDKSEANEGEEMPEKMPQIVIIIDELADLMMVAPGDVEGAICRLAQLARAAGIYLVIATQRPSVNVITGLIKANVPSRISFAVSSGVDSRTILDMNGAEKLLGKGDMLFFPSGYPKPVRVQGAFVSDEEVSKVVDFLKENMQQEVVYNEEIGNMEISGGAETHTVSHAENERDSYFADAGRFVIEKEKGSIGMLQRYYKIGFNRAGRIMDQLSQAGVVGPEIGTKPRKVEMTLDEFEAYLKEHNIN